MSCKNNFALKCIPGPLSIGVLPLGQGGRPPDVRVGLEIFQNATYIISSKFCKNNFALKRIPGLLPIGVLPLGQGGRAPDVRVGLQIFQNAAHIISSKFCKKNSALKCIPALVLIGVTPEVLHEDYPQADDPGAGVVGDGPDQAPDSKTRGPDQSNHTPYTHIGSFCDPPWLFKVGHIHS